MRKNQKSKIKYQKLNIFLNFAFLILNFTFITVAFAAEEAEHPFSFKDLLWPIINFAILVTILVKFLSKPAKEFLKKRTEMIEKSIKDAEEAKELARKALAEITGRLKNTDREIEEILKTAKKAGENEKEALIAEGERLRNKILEQAKANIEFELQRAKETIKSEAAMAALELAEKELKEKLTKKEQEKLLKESLTKIGGSS